jgi:hypothetical protein
MIELAMFIRIVRLLERVSSFKRQVLLAFSPSPGSIVASQAPSAGLTRATPPPEMELSARAAPSATASDYTGIL